MKFSRWVEYSFIAISYFAEAFGDTETYEFGEDCSVLLKAVNENRQIYVEYNGKEVLSHCTDYSFTGKRDDSFDEYEVCVTPLTFTDPNCAIQLKYKSAYYGETLQSVTCSDNYNKKYCGSQDEYLYIFFESRNRNYSPAKFKLLVTANKVFDYGALVGAIVGGVIGGIVLITLLTGLVCWCVCKRKPTQGRVLNPCQTNQASMGNQPGYPQAAYTIQPTGNSVGLYPTANYATQYSTGYTTQPPFQTQQAGGWQPAENQPSAPPPSYTEVNK